MHSELYKLESGCTVLYKFAVLVICVTMCGGGVGAGLLLSERREEESELIKKKIKFSSYIRKCRM
jgi:hypothetical protein